MTLGKAWVAEAAEEIDNLVRLTDALDPAFQELLQMIILKHCPFLPDVAYEPVREGPLLMCVDCKNTESPAGAMARQHFNPGRCMHCGGYFKVIRA